MSSHESSVTVQRSWHDVGEDDAQRHHDRRCASERAALGTERGFEDTDVRRKGAACTVGGATCGQPDVRSESVSSGSPP